MTADREQTRRDAVRGSAANLKQAQQDIAATTADLLDALLAELEQAERERDEARDTVIDQAMRIEAIKAAKELLQGRLAKVPALVEALRYIADNSQRFEGTALAALAAYEQEHTDTQNTIEILPEGPERWSRFPGA